MPSSPGLKGSLMLKNLTSAERTSAVKTLVLLHGAVVVIQCGLAIVTGSNANWYVAMGIMVLMAIEYVWITPNE